MIIYLRCDGVDRHAFATIPGGAESPMREVVDYRLEGCAEPHGNIRLELRGMADVGLFTAGKCYRLTVEEVK